jgi:hypothetical protein
VLGASLKLAFRKVQSPCHGLMDQKLPTLPASYPKRAKAARSGARSNALAFSVRKYLAISLVFQFEKMSSRLPRSGGPVASPGRTI